MISLMVALALAAGGPGPRFIADDYPKALALAKQRHLPLFVDAQTSWCHTCRYLRATLLSDPAVGAQAKRFVWLSLDTEKKSSAAFDAKFPIASWPTFLFVDPASEKIALRWAGSLSTARFLALLDEGAAAVRGSETGPLAVGRRLDAAGKPGEAAVAYAQAVAAAPAGSTLRGQALEAQVVALESAGGGEACASAFLSQAASVPQDGAFVDSVTTALGCGLDEAPEKLSQLPDLIRLGTQALTIAEASDDDRSGLYEALVQASAALHPEDKGPSPLASDWVKFLDQAAERAKSTEQRAALDAHRIEAAEAAGDLSHARPFIERTAVDLPRDYNAHARLSTLYRKLGLRPDALLANEKALALAYGPRRLRLLEERAHLELLGGDSHAAEEIIARALTEAAALPESQRSPLLTAKLMKEQAALVSEEK